MNTLSRLTLLFAAAWLGTAVGLSGCGEPTPTTGPELFRAWGCVNCHGTNGTGIQGLGPSLWGKYAHWTPETLHQYLRDPVGYASRDPRLREQMRGFMTPMPPVLTQDQEKVRRVIDHVLGLR